MLRSIPCVASHHRKSPELEELLGLVGCSVSCWSGALLLRTEVFAKERPVAAAVRNHFSIEHDDWFIASVAKGLGVAGAVSSLQWLHHFHDEAFAALALASALMRRASALYAVMPHSGMDSLVPSGSGK